MTCLMLNQALMPAVTEPTNYKSISTKKKLTADAIKTSHLSPYNPVVQRNHEGFQTTYNKTKIVLI
jgi:hypothetical protein